MLKAATAGTSRTLRKHMACFAWSLTLLGTNAQEALRQAAEAKQREREEQDAAAQAAVDLERLRQVGTSAPTP